MKPIRIGTRKSPLALAQAQEVAKRLSHIFPGVATEIVAMSTTGDTITDRLLIEAGGKGLFTKELEDALLQQRIDIAVHSMKDMPTQQQQGLAIGAVLAREDARDVLICHRATSLSELPQGAVFGTASLRRAAQLLHIRPDIQLVPLRGNVGTRLRKIEEGVAMATMLARAGLNRLKLVDVPAYDIPITECLPAVAQGAISIECRADDADIRAMLQPLTCKLTFAAVTCERAFLRVLDGSCRTPIAGHAEVNNGEILFRGLIANPDGTNLRRTEIRGTIADAQALGKQAAEQLRSL